MSFNPDPSKQAKEITFSKKRSNTQLPVLIFNNSIISPSDSHKHLGMILDRKLEPIKTLFTYFQTQIIIIYQTLIEICMESFW